MRELWDRTLERVEEGRNKDKVKKIPTGVQKFDKFIGGTKQRTMYLIGAETSVGKTTWVRDKHIYTPYEHFKQVNDPSKLDVLFVDFSLEMSPEINMAGGISRKLFTDKRVVISTENILEDLSDEGFALVKGLEGHFRDFLQRLYVIDEDLSPDKYHDVLMEIAKLTGKFAVEARWISQCKDWKPNNPNQYVIVTVDTVNLAEDDNAMIKRIIDRISRISVWFRNKCRFTIILIQQFNADISGVERVHKYGIKTPMLRDFEDSKRPVKDADVVLGLYDPSRHLREDETFFHGYDITIMKDWFRSIHVIKNRYGQNNKFIPLKFDGEVGVFSQLPDADKMTQLDYTLATDH